MNYAQRATLRVVGVILFVFSLLFNIMFIPIAQDIRLADNICNLQIDAGFNIEIGKIGQAILGAGNDCYRIHVLKLGVDYAWIVIVLGAILFFIGIWAGLGAKDRRRMFGYK